MRASFWPTPRLWLRIRTISPPPRDELSHLQWIDLDAVRHFDLPFITEVVLAEVAARADSATPPSSVPFFRNDDEESLFLRLRGQPMT